MVDLWTPGKTFGYGAVLGIAVDRIIPPYIEKRLQAMGERAGEIALLKMRESQGTNPSISTPGNGEYGTVELYNRMASTLDQMTSTLTQMNSNLEKLGKSYGKGE